MRETLHLTDNELYQLLDIIDFTINCILVDIGDLAKAKDYHNTAFGMLSDYSNIYHKIDYALNCRIKKEELKKQCKE